MKATRKVLARFLACAVAACTILAVVYFFLIISPSILFTCRTEVGNCRIYSNESFPADSMIVYSLQKLNRSGLMRDDTHFDIFICDNYSLYTFLAPASRNSFGVHYPVTGNIILTKSDLQCGTVTRNGTDNNIRSLESVLAHEMTHRLIESEFGFWKTRFMPAWKEEGFCEYIAGASSYDVKEGLKIFAYGKDDGSLSYRYFTYRLFVTCLTERKGLTIRQIAERDFDLEQLSDEIRSLIREQGFTL